MHVLTPILPLAYLILLLPYASAVAKIQKKIWHEMPSATQDVPQKLDPYQQQSGTDYSSGGMAAEYPVNDYGQSQGGYESSANGYSNGGHQNGGYESANGYISNGGPQNGGYESSNGYSNGGPQSGGYESAGNGYSNMQPQQADGYSNGGGDSYSNSYSESHSGYGGGRYSDHLGGSGGYGDGLGGGGYGDNLGGGYGDGLGGWDKDVKTVVKHVYKNIAVPHAVPTPVQVTVPKYVKYFKPFAVARPVGVPHIIPVIKHVQKPIPFFASFPIHQSVPVPKFISLPVQVRVPRPVFIHVPKIVPVAKKYPVPVQVNVPKPYIVPVYKHVPVPVPHRVPKVINVVKEVPHYVKKPVPVYIDPHSGEFGPMNSFSGSGYTNSDYGNENNNNKGYASEEDSYYNGPLGHSQTGHPNNYQYGYNSGGGNDYGHQQTYNNAQETMNQNTPYYYNRQKVQGFNQPKQVYPANSYPRSQRLPNGQTMGNAPVILPNYYDSHQTPISNASNGYGYTGNGPAYSTDVQPQSPAPAPNELYYQNAHANGVGATSGSYMPPAGMPTSNSGYSQPIYSPNGYADYAISQQQYNQQMQYVQNNTSLEPPPTTYSDSTSTTTTTTTSSPVMQSEASKLYPNYQQHPFSSGPNLNQQSNNFNSIPQLESYPNFNEPKQQYAHKTNFDFNNPFKQQNPYQAGNNKVSQWVSNFLQNSNNGANRFMQHQHQDAQVTSFFHQPPQNTGIFNKDLTNFNIPSNNGFNNIQHNSKPQSYNYPESNHNNKFHNFENYVPSGSSHSSSSYSNSVSPPSMNFQNMNNDQNDYKYNNEKFDQSPSSFSPSSNSAIPNGYSPSGQSQSFSANNFGKEYSTSQHYSPQEPRQTPGANRDYSLSKTTNNEASNFPSSYSSNFGTKTQEFSPPNPQQMQNNNDVNGQTNAFSEYSNSPTYSQQGTKQADFLNMDFRNPEAQPQPDTLSSFLESASSQSFSQPIDTSYTSSSTSLTNSNSYSMTPESSQQSSMYSSPDGQVPNNNNDNNVSSFSNNQPLVDSPGVTASYSYSYTQQETQPPPSYPNSLYSGSFASDGQFKEVAQQSQSQYQPQTSFSDPQQLSKPSEQAYSPQQSDTYHGYIPKIEPTSYSASEPYPSYSNLNGSPVQASDQTSQSDAYQGFVPKTDSSSFFSSPESYPTFNSQKIDEMDQHLQESSAAESSIINVYTNSPDSKEAKKGQTFTFVDSASLESSQSPQYYLPPNPGTTSKNKYSNSDVQIIQAPSFNQDPNEPLQTSLDAYVPVQPVYYPPNGEPSTTYKEALSIAESTVYKEALNMDSSGKE
ncbi:hypothetical protein JTE90_026960 [Oedothorax gibbosus]|uniref:Uncharacterized protein n=1 Tax=Oedothorax gibbosus TaxID=931172 RepID=A0AAV6UX07_9ARAC|nr:hypothetical protein JTE90_026960 [Oedothorax gibbosus]